MELLHFKIDWCTTIQFPHILLCTFIFHTAAFNPSVLWKWKGGISIDYSSTAYNMGFAHGKSQAGSNPSLDS